jgi:hypothetical protein
MSNNVLELHNEEITNIKYVFYKPDLTFKEIQDDINNILYNTSKISCTYLYLEDRCSYYMFIPHGAGETILAIQIKRVIDYIDPGMINEKHPIYHESAIKTKYCIEILRHKGITDYKIIRGWLIKQLEAHSWIKEKINNTNEAVETITTKILAL